MGRNHYGYVRAKPLKMEEKKGFFSPARKKKGNDSDQDPRQRGIWAILLAIRGQGAGLSWDKGVALKNLSADEWVWETDASFKDCEFKVLLNDQRYEEGENHRLKKGKICITPRGFRIYSSFDEYTQVDAKTRVAKKILKLNFFAALRLCVSLR